jgi:ABC-type sugar transport system substrate-binding protein
LTEPKKNETKISRRSYLKYVGGAAVAVGAAAAGYYYTTLPGPAPPLTQTTTASTGPLNPAEKAKALATAKPGEKFLIGNITLALTNEPGALCSEGAKQACDALGLDYVVRDTGWSSVAPLDAARELVALGCKGIVSYALDPAVVANVAKICNDNKIFFTNIYSFLPFTYPWSIGDYYLHFDSQDGDTEENVLSTLLFQKLKGKGTVAHIQGTANYAANAEKNFGIWRAWQNYPNIKLVGHQYGQWNADTAKTTMEQILVANPDVNGAVCINDSMAVGVANASSSVGPNTVGVDGVRTAMEYIRDGKMFLATSYMPPYEDGRAVCMLYDAITGAHYPSDEERMHAPISLVVCKDPNEIQQLSQDASFKIPFTVVSADEVMAKVFTAQKYPWDWRKISRGKAAELGLEYDLYGGFAWGGVKTITHLFGSPENYSRYTYDALARFTDFKANTIEEARAPPYAPTAESPNVDPYQQWIS